MNGIEMVRILIGSCVLCLVLVGCQDDGGGSDPVAIDPIVDPQPEGDATTGSTTTGSTTAANTPNDDPVPTTGGDGTDSSSTPDPEGDGEAFDAQRLRQSLTGRWMGPCQSENDIWVRSLIDFDDDDSSIGATGYLVSGCTSPAFEISTTMTFGIGNEIVLANSVRVAEMDITYGNSVRMTITNELFRLASNANNYCGQSDWVLSVSYDITGCSESAVVRPFLGSTRFQIVKLDSPTMYLGEEDNIDTVRSPALDLQVPYMRAP